MWIEWCGGVWCGGGLEGVGMGVGVGVGKRGKGGVGREVGVGWVVGLELRMVGCG